MPPSDSMVARLVFQRCTKAKLVLTEGEPKDEMIEITANDRLGKKVRVKCNPTDTIGDLKKLIAAQTGTKWDRIILKKWYNVYKDPVTLADYEIKDGMNLELYYK
ncbi:hypothetical protein ACTXT7_004296 [Hymenolepis weldensis]